jgi:prevent-host-death family protein
MDEIVSVRAAKTHLSKLLARVEAEEAITIARGRTPVAKLVPIAPKGKREFGAMREKSALARSFSSHCGMTSAISEVNRGCGCRSIPVP